MEVTHQMQSFLTFKAAYECVYASANFPYIVLLTDLFFLNFFFLPNILSFLSPFFFFFADYQHDNISGFPLGKYSIEK